MICTMFGHKDAPKDIEPHLERTIKNLIVSGVICFYVGNNGNFDFYAQRTLKKIAENYDNVSFSVVLSTINESAIGTEQKNTIFPDGLEKSLPRFAIAKRNDWMINNSQIVIAYVKHTFSNSHKWIEKARKKGLRIINLEEHNF